MYCHERFARVTTEGPPGSFFPVQSTAASRSASCSLAGSIRLLANGGDSSTIATSDLASDPTASNERGSSIPDDLFHSSNVAEDIAAVRNLGFLVDNDNDPAPENVPE